MQLDGYRGRVLYEDRAARISIVAGGHYSRAGYAEADGTAPEAITLADGAGHTLIAGGKWAAKRCDQRHIGDFRRWKDREAYQQAFDRVLRDLKASPG